MNKVLLFAIDYKKNEVIVSESSKENNKINFIERIKKNDNNVFFNTVVELTNITKAPSLDIEIFKSADRECQMIYHKHKEFIKKNTGKID